jgi:hypothetical protein
MAAYFRNILYFEINTTMRYNDAIKSKKVIKA